MNYKVYSVLFNNNVKPYNFKSTEDIDVKTNVIVDTEKGLQYGAISGVVTRETNLDEVKEIVRVATKEDEEMFYKNLRDSDKALQKTKELVKELELTMYVISAQYNFDRSQLLINFSADDRVDFRELAKKLASIYKTRIELRQIGARDKAKQVCGIGVCGQTLCCSRFLKQIDSISMNKAKNQGLSLNPSKINGACGRLLCCLTYEDEEYTRCNKNLLPMNSRVKVQGKEGKIVGIDILAQKYKVLIDEEIVEVLAKDVKDDRKK